MSSSTDDVVEVIRLAPDAGLVNSLGANHTLESAIADIVDNSIDAGATRVSVRLMTRDDRLTQVEIMDDGKGMDARAINNAMTIGHQRDYGDGDLGHFGMGLKAASFGHGNVLTVWSTMSGATSVGRRIRKADFSKDFTCEILATAAAIEHESDRDAVLGTTRGTTVVWTEVRNAYRGHDAGEARTWLATRNDVLRAHLGITFHRLIADERLRIDILVDELGAGLGAHGVPVMPIDPFAYAISGHPGYPKDLIAKAGDTQVKLRCHIWPAKSDVTGFRIGAKSGEQFQGFYIFRNDRLLQVGGWSETATPGPARQLARVELEDSGAIGTFLAMNPEKSGLKFEPVFHDAINRAESSDGTTFRTYLQDAETTYATANKRKRYRKPVIRPDKGLAPAVRKQIGIELPYIDGDSVSLKWARMPEGEFFDIDVQRNTLLLNNRYRALFAPDGGSLNDAPVVKALMFLLTHHLFEGHHLGVRDKDEIALWKCILGAAVVAESQMRSK
ncbi:ATP-binding protein [Rhodococcus sp. Q]|uniref:ATP-binding protein n=1 Tax=Rhodococcus sp. Q TaxID=2502252 RepID=UPI0010F8E7A6|nr:ATP-binding protein [Rhodococcus sp. Q]